MITILMAGCSEYRYPGPNSKIQEEKIIGTVKLVSSNNVGQHWVCLDDKRVLMFDTGTRTITPQNAIIVNSSELESISKLNPGDYCEWNIARTYDIYYTYGDTPWKLINFTKID